jgi:excisionase family DNA binding protein
MRQQPTISSDLAPSLTRRHLRRRRAAVTERLLSQEEAARLAGCSKDTIVRARRNGRFPNARLRDRRWAIPTDDLAAAGFYHPEGHETTGPEFKETVEGTEPSAVQLARALARVAALEDLVARQDDQLAFLRQLTVDTLTKRGAL